jgi:transposase InsO family protein
MRMHKEPREVARYHDINISNPTVSCNLGRNGLNQRPTGTRTRKVHAGRCHKLCVRNKVAICETHCKGNFWDNAVVETFFKTVKS